MSKVSIKEKIDKFIYQTHNFISDIGLVNYRYKKLLIKNRKFKDLHSNERCFILGTGPSLKNINPTFLKNEITFGVNFLYKSEIINSFIPQYYCLYDNIFHTTERGVTKEIIEKLPDTTFFLRTKAFNAIDELGINNDKVFFQNCNLFQYDDLIKVDMEKNMTAPFNVVLGCIQTAIYMGFKEIYLLGCDFNSFASMKVEHCYDRNDAPDRKMSIGFELKYYSMVSFHHYALEKYSKKNNIRIFNLTPNSLLDAYERKKLEEVISI